MLNLDTHIIVSFLNGTIGEDEKNIMDESRDFYVSSIVLWELAMLHSKKRVNFDFFSLNWLGFSKEVKNIPITQEIAIQSMNLDFKSDPADTIIAATSIVSGIPLLTKDKIILKSKIVPFA